MSASGKRGRLRTYLAAAPGAGKRLGARRVAVGWILALAGPVGLTALLVTPSHRSGPSFEALSLLAITVGCALVGGLWPALACAVVSTVLLNYFFTPPLHTLTIADSKNFVTLLLFLAVAVGVASVVDRAARRSILAEQARREADTLSMLNHTLLSSDQSVHTTLELVCATFGMRSASLLEEDGRGGWLVREFVGAFPPTEPGAGDVETEATGPLRLVLSGHELSAQDLRVLSAFATHLSVALEREEMGRREAAARQAEEGDRMRSALLAAVSHDLRTPLAGIKAAVSTLQTPGIEWSDADRAELLAAIDHSSDRLQSIVTNLLDMSRLQTGIVHLEVQEVGLDDVVFRAVDSVVDPGSVDIDLPVDLPDVRVDAALLDRVIANLVQNAARHSPPGSQARVMAVAQGDRVQLRVIDHGPGVSDPLKGRMFQPFQRLDDRHTGTGVGLGLAVAKGLTEALGGALTAEDTPGGGLTMVVELPCASPGPAPVEQERG